MFVELTMEPSNVLKVVGNINLMTMITLTFSNYVKSLRLILPINLRVQDLTFQSSILIDGEDPKPQPASGIAVTR